MDTVKHYIHPKVNKTRSRKALRIRQLRKQRAERKHWISAKKAVDLTTMFEHIAEHGMQPWMGVDWIQTEVIHTKRKYRDSKNGQVYHWRSTCER